jgi:hypothetical protein
LIFATLRVADDQKSADGAGARNASLVIMRRHVHRTSQIIAHERNIERSLVPFAIAMTILALGFVFALITLYR